MAIKAKANIIVRPLGGQIIPFSLLAISSILFFVGIWLEMQERSYALAITGSVVSFSGAISLYLLSRRDSDLQKAHRFEMKLGAGSKQVAIRSDSRSLPALDYLRGILFHYSSLLEREPLPQASGTIDGNGNPVPNSSDVAKEVTSSANEAAQAQVDAVVAQMKMYEAEAKSSPVVDSPDVIESQD